jgi:hypothetical protein
MSLGSLATVRTAGTSPGNRSDTEPLPSGHRTSQLTDHPRTQGWGNRVLLKRLRPIVDGHCQYSVRSRRLDRE